MEAGTRRMQLVFDPPVERDRSDKRDASSRALPLHGAVRREVPEGPSILCITEPPEGPSAAADSVPPDAVLVEPVEVEGLPVLLLLLPPATVARVNGVPALRVELLRGGDRMLVDGRLAFRVALLHGGRRVAAGPEHLSRTCAVCRGAFTAGMEIYACRCGVLMHCEPEEACGGTNEDARHAGRQSGRLSCAFLRPDCPGCGCAVAPAEPSGAGEGDLP
jgi:hypothetical protein